MENIEKDFDTLAKQVNKVLEGKNDIQQTTSKSIKNIFSQRIKQIPQSIDEIYGLEELWLSPRQKDALFLASDLLRAFEWFKQEIEERKIGKNEEELKKIEKDLEEGNDFFDSLYTSYKKRFS